MATVPALGQDAIPAVVRAGESVIQLDQIDTLRVSPRGVVEGGGQPRGNCGVLSSHTDANFSGGSFIVQAGFAENEWLAASYVIPAAAFPIKIDLVECIFATSNATQPTTTRWSIGFWSGIPTTGTLVDLFVADDIILPYIRLPAGTNGVNLQFFVDPGDPEQIIINNPGNQTFTVGIRIDDHNQGPANPCTTSPPTCCNAFPTTDVSGLASPTNNWLNGLNCGQFGCPPNGGWARFSNLTSFCRPSGDWVIRVTWSSVSCQPGVGPCCINGNCVVTTQSDCSAAGGIYQGDGSSCSGISCPQPTQACCFPGTGGCIDLTPSDCSAAGGVPAGPGTNCGTTNCNPIGACCLPNGGCLGNVSAADCQAAGGVYRGNGSTCTSNLCQYACCFPTSFCLMLTKANCDQGGATWFFNQTCADGNGNGTADVCEAAPCDGDVNGDRVVDLSDLTTLLSNFGTPSGATRSQGDLDADGDVDLNDLTLLLARFGVPC